MPREAQGAQGGLRRANYETHAKQERLINCRYGTMLEANWVSGQLIS